MLNLGLPPSSQKSERGPAFPSDIRQAAFSFVFLCGFFFFFFLHSLNTVRLFLPPQCLSPHIATRSKRRKKNWSSLPPLPPIAVSVGEKGLWTLPHPDLEVNSLLPREGRFPQVILGQREGAKLMSNQRSRWEGENQKIPRPQAPPSP